MVENVENAKGRVEIKVGERLTGNIGPANILHNHQPLSNEKERVLIKEQDNGQLGNYRIHSRANMSRNSSQLPALVAGATFFFLLSDADAENDDSLSLFI